MEQKLTKDKMKKLIEVGLENYPLAKKYFLDVIFNLIDNHSPNKSIRELLEFQLVRYTMLNDSVVANLEKHLSEREFTNIIIPINRLKNNFSEYDSVMAELRVAKILRDEGMTNILFISDEGNPDIQYKNIDVTQYAEVKSLDELDPEFLVLNNKLEAISILDSRYKKDFYIRLNDASQSFSNLVNYKEELSKAVDRLIVLLKKYLKRAEVKDVVLQIREFIFTVSFNTKRPGYFLMYGGEVMKYGSGKDIFLKVSSVYSRFINQAARGIKQLAKKREQSPTYIKQDRLYIFLNSGRYAGFVPDELGKIINELSKLLGIDDLVTLKILL